MCSSFSCWPALPDLPRPRPPSRSVYGRRRPTSRLAEEGWEPCSDSAGIVGNMRERMPVEAKITHGAPYSADAVTESTQVLPDGNRINRKVTTRVYRDSEGRTRREQLGEKRHRGIVSIVDPVGDVTFVVKPEPARLPGGDPGPGLPRIAGERRRRPTSMFKRTVKIDGPADEAKMKAELTSGEPPGLWNAPRKGRRFVKISARQTSKG